jgi:hypothetical protein
MKAIWKFLDLKCEKIIILIILSLKVQLNYKTVLKGKLIR